MERLVRKYEQSFRRAREELDSWNALQARLLRQFGNAVAILERLPVLIDPENYGVLVEDEEVDAMARDLPAAQVESLEAIFRAMAKTLEEFLRIRSFVQKLWRDGRQLIMAERQQPTALQLRQRVGPRASLQDCIDGLHSLYRMHDDEYNLKVALVSALSYSTEQEAVLALQSLLAGEPNIPFDEVQHIFDLISAGK